MSENGSRVSERKASACGIIFHPLSEKYNIFFSQPLRIILKGDFFMQKNQTKKLVITSLFIALGLVLSLFRQMVYFGGGGGMRLSVSGYITTLPAFMFGPFWGGMTNGICDILSYLIKPEGGYLFPLTVTAVLGGVMRGFGWKMIKDKKITYPVFVCVFSAFIIFGAVNMFFIGGDTSYSHFLQGFNKKIPFLTYAPITFGAVSCVFLAVNKMLSKTKFYSDNYLNVLCVLMTVNIIITTLNTFVLMMFVPELSKLAFSYFYIPRLIQEIASTSIQSYVVSYLLKVSKRLY